MAAVVRIVVDVVDEEVVEVVVVEVKVKVVSIGVDVVVEVVEGEEVVVGCDVAANDSYVKLRVAPL